MDLAALAAEGARLAFAELGHTGHPVIPPSLAPPALIHPLRTFLNEFPFETNVFAMTRFPSRTDASDLLIPAIDAASSVCKKHGKRLHMAWDSEIVPELWPNVAAHMWGCQFGIGFFEARTERGLNYNLNIEVGSCLALGRRTALLKDCSLEKLPTDLVGHIYYEVDLDEPETVTNALTEWWTSGMLGSSPTKT
jgi:hypothetical protein